ncbi:MAG: helix-turn-helix domain-containing protein [Kofleriaceae bacterium]
MERASFARMECPIARAADEIADGWTLLLLREAFKGAALFSEFQERLPITPTTLTRKLDALTSRGFFEKKEYSQSPVRERYELTPKATDLMPVLLALGAWGNRWLAPEGELLSIVDPATKRPMDVMVVDAKTSLPLRAGRVALLPGKGATKRVRERLTSPLVLGTNHHNMEKSHG